MAGRGPAPKAADRRVRRNKDTVVPTVINFEHGEQPPLPSGIVWPERTIDFWEKWGRSPLAEHFMEVDWEELLSTALIHADFWSGNLAAAAELRIRMAAFGATLEARSRLRIQFAEAKAAETANGDEITRAPSAASRYASVTPLRAVETGS